MKYRHLNIKVRKKTGAKWVTVELRRKRALGKEEKGAKTLQQIFTPELFQGENQILAQFCYMKTNLDENGNWELEMVDIDMLVVFQPISPLLLFAVKQMVANGFNTLFREKENILHKFLKSYKEIRQFGRGPITQFLSFFHS